MVESHPMTDKMRIPPYLTQEETNVTDANPVVVRPNSLLDEVKSGNGVKSKPNIEDPRRFDEIQKAQHYNVHPSGVECIDVVQHENFNIGSAIKYLWRRNDKGDTVKDLEKARYYIDKEIERLRKSH